MELYTNDFNYYLPEERIAQFPSDRRHDSKLLIYDGKTISHAHFRDIASYLPKDSMLVFNNSKVVPARMHFKKSSGAIVEVFLLGPVNSATPYQSFFASKPPVQFLCTIGNKKKWTTETLTSIVNENLKINATLIDRDQSIVELDWDGNLTLAEILQVIGEVPLPPYIKRKAIASDSDRYQTIYAIEPGAVAAPTAGLHFTNEVLKSIGEFGIKCEYLTLHVGAGTFLPIKSEKIEDHKMHHERIVFNRKNVENLLSHNGKITAVGTTSCRSLESMYWFGYKLLTGHLLKYEIEQDLPYNAMGNLPSISEAISAIRSNMDSKGVQEITITSSIFIYPPYQFKMTDALITNFHQPNSSLILLVAAFVGPKWKNIYQEAIEKGYRFLSYGDSSLLFVQ